ncbi:peptidoglycan DD-metalloendopeptidase family protein [Teredinibacter turnerae]|uniref:peptidoglycan DD-metalloendopeptidase family protein n=1 Tax=Teredinibacter turnerae TaxID=2426 RepID=UPI000368C6BE|nr:peptidoglycan DD-metalloendopeptidase family protein [Teredinibacter turnerae]
MFRILIILCVIGVCLTGCTSGTYKAPVTDRGRPPGERIGHHIVAKGETLYSIAWRYNVDYHALAAANGVGSTYHIYPGQRLTLDVTRVPPKPSIKRTTKTVVSAPPKVVKTPPRSKIQTPSISQKPIKKAPKVDPSWHWPASGKLIATFSSNGGLNKGIDIQGKLGEPVHAAAAGIVVYSGSGLRGYGKLLIVKHNAKFLSAYAHNRRLLAKEGERVKRGQKIAEMGSSGTDAVKLHFEIRFDGTPVDPMKYLPRR